MKVQSPKSGSACLVTICFLLGGCSYSYDVQAIVHQGQIMFVVASTSSSTPSCLREIQVIAQGDRRPSWSENIDYSDGCANTFPVVYGRKFQGRHQQEWPSIPAQKLRKGVVYQVLTTTGATGYGNGVFIINSKRQVENLNPKSQH